MLSSPKSFAKPTIVRFTVPIRLVSSARFAIKWRSSLSALCITSATYRFKWPFDPAVFGSYVFHLIYVTRMLPHERTKGLKPSSAGQVHG